MFPKKEKSKPMMGSWHEKPVEQPTMAEQNWACYTSTAVHESDESSTATPRRASLHRPISSVKDGRRVISLSLSLAPPRPPAPRMTPPFLRRPGTPGRQEGKTSSEAGRVQRRGECKTSPAFRCNFFPRGCSTHLGSSIELLGV
jgi:hypothetical protein